MLRGLEPPSWNWCLGLPAAAERSPRGVHVPASYCVYKNRDDTFSINNGLLLRNDIHRLFDSGYIDFVQVATDVIVKIDPRLASFNEYKVLKDKKLKLPKKGRELWLKTLEERNVIT